MSSATGLRERSTAVLHLTVRWLSIGYPLAVLAIIVGLRLVGEHWWATTVALYLPRVPLALPVIPLTAAIIWVGPRRLLWTQALAMALLLVLSGFRVSWPQAPAPGAFSLRIVSCNINSGNFGADEIARALRATNADIIAMQEVDSEVYRALRAGLPGYHIRENGQFWLASRFPIDEVRDPPRKVVDHGPPRSMHFVRYQLLTPAGPLTLYNTHPVSPRDGLREIQGNGIRNNLLTNRSRLVVSQNTAQRVAQLQALADDAAHAYGPVLIVGDTNSPGLSWAFAHVLGTYRDGFIEAGRGFGYTFPSPGLPWMRIDRILASAQWRFLSFRVLDPTISDHYAITADLELTAQGTVHSNTETAVVANKTHNPMK